MPRIAPDGYDVLVLPLNDGPGTHVNYGTSGTPGNWTDYGNPVSGVQGLLGDAVYIPSTYLTTVHDGCGGGNDILVTPNISLSGWVYMRKILDGNSAYAFEIFNKQYFLNAWSNPFITFGIQLEALASGPSGGWTFYMTVAGILRSVTMGDGNLTGKNLINWGRWCHVGGTWDGTTLIAYLNGSMVGSSSAFPGTIDYGTAGNRGQWYTGAVPGSNPTNQNPAILVQDIRVANIVRPQSYFANIYYNGFIP